MVTRRLKALRKETILYITVNRAAIAAFCRKLPNREVSLFGPVLRDDSKPESNIDVFVKLLPGHGLGLFDKVDMREELKQIFQPDVNLVSKGGFRERAVLASALVVYAA